MLTIIHGDDEVKIHACLVGKLEESKKKGIEVIRLAGKGLSIENLENAIGTQELFASEKLVVIDGLLSLPKSKLKEELLGWVKTHDSDTVHVILIEVKILTATQLKQLPDASVTVFKVPVLLFQFMETIGLVSAPKAITLFHGILVTQDPEFVFVMLIRQVRMLLAFVADGTYDGPPFGRQKLTKQAAVFTVEKLLVLHRKLLEIDSRQKTSKNSLSLVQEIDLLLTDL